MKIKGFNVTIVLFAFVLSLVGLLAFERILGAYTVDRPLRKALGEMEGVQAFELMEDSGMTNLFIQLTEVDDLQRTYKELHRVAEKMLGKRLGAIRIMDNRDAVLTELYHKVHYSLYEAAVKGNFEEMAARVRSVLDSFKDVSYKLSVDNSTIYFQMKHGDKYLYETIPRFAGSDMVDLESRGESWW